MSTADGRFTIALNGEIYNYVELRDARGGRVAFRTSTDTEVLLSEIAVRGPACLDELIGMFAFAVWDERSQTLFAARDRFGVKPLYYHAAADGGVYFASEIRALHEAGVPRERDPAAWATYLASGMYDHTPRTFWKGIQRVPPGCWLGWTQATGVTIRRWYDLGLVVAETESDTRPETLVAEEALALLDHSVRLRFRADVPVGVCLSGGLDSALLLALVNRLRGPDARIKAFTFVTGDARYDERPWVEAMLARTGHESFFSELRPEDVPRLASRVQWYQDEPFGGLPTLGMATVHARAREEGVTVLLDGNGMDEAWAGYDYYRHAATVDLSTGPVQGARGATTRPDCLDQEFARQAVPFLPARVSDPLRALQHRDLCEAKIPRAMRFADRVSMMHSRELREPFLDHRLVELGLRQPADRKIRDGRSKWLIRRIVSDLVPDGVREAPKRPVQTPQREWLRGPLAPWAADLIEVALSAYGGTWLDRSAVRRVWLEYLAGAGDNSFPVWQWLSLGLSVVGSASRVQDGVLVRRLVP
jgi:asparagine synthase (glutamine-hydrolysing)